MPRPEYYTPMTNIPFILNKTVVVRRRKGWQVGSAPRDVLNAPSYGDPTTWDIVYAALKCRIETMGASIQFKPTGERIPPQVIMFIDDDVDVRPEDRIFDGTMTWIVEGKQTHYNTVGGIHHYEYTLLVT